MAITDPRAISFGNTRLRPMADLLRQAYFTAKSLIAQWNAQSLSSLFPNTSAVLQDSAAPDGVDAVGGDGRPILKGTDANNIITRATDLVNWMEGSTGIAAGDGSKAVLNTVEGVHVNGAPLF